MAQNVTFITKKVNSGGEFDNQNSLFTDKRNVLGHFGDVHFVTLEGSEKGEVQKVSPKGIDWQRETAKMTKWTSQKWPKTLRLSVKKLIQDVKFTTKIHFFTDKRNVLGHFCDVRFVTLEGSENGKVQKSQLWGISKGKLPLSYQNQPLSMRNPMISNLFGPDSVAGDDWTNYLWGGS